MGRQTSPPRAIATTKTQSQNSPEGYTSSLTPSPNTTSRSRTTSATMISNLSRGPWASCTRKRNCGRTRAGERASAARGSRPSLGRSRNSLHLLVLDAGVKTRTSDRCQVSRVLENFENWTSPASQIRKPSRHAKHKFASLPRHRFAIAKGDSRVDGVPPLKGRSIITRKKLDGRGIQDELIRSVNSPPWQRRGIPAHSVFLVCCKLSGEIRIS